MGNVQKWKDREKREMFHRDLSKWAKEGMRNFPWRDSATSEYEILVAEMLLRLTLAEKVEPVYTEFVNKYPNFRAVQNADEKKLIEILGPLGLQNRRAKAFKDVARELGDSGVPSDVDSLLELPHIGKYAANAVVCFGSNKRRPLVDTNILRIYSRIFGFDADRDQRDGDLWKFAGWMLPERNVRRYNFALLDFGAKICTAQSPTHESCFAREYCKYYNDLNE